jgi:hypothetical protein
MARGHLSRRCEKFRESRAQDGVEIVAALIIDP